MPMRHVWSRHLATAADCAAIRCPSASALNLHQPVRQLVAVERAGREVLGQHRAALLDRGDETVAWAALLYSSDQRADRRVPPLRRPLGVDTGVRHDLGVALGHCGKDQHAGAVLGVMQALGKELLHGLDMGALVLGAARHDVKADGWHREPNGRGDEEEELYE